MHCSARTSISDFRRLKPVSLRILSDIHFGDRASVVDTLESLLPLLDGAERIVLNGDTLDTRRGGNRARTERLRSEVESFFANQPVPVTLLSGNHDPDIGATHLLDLAEGRLLLTHGDIVFDDIVPWSREVEQVRVLLGEELARLGPRENAPLEALLAAYRRASERLPQRHQGESNPLKHALGYLKDTVWPPQRIARILRVWSRTPGLADALLARHRPNARFLVMGHTHRAGVWTLPRGTTVINTGSYCHPFGPAAVDLEGDSLCFRPVVRRKGEFRLARNARRLSLD